ncbi:MAG: CHAP domain-containing protein [Kineosporiaceae bacterium]|nr:CHAP domain-containing protein [Kineosporiaceae bacterium]MBK7624441.1 CHAP domain-containing protein [Kineosporiaceae bacterium]MBK8077805.1 CHAP domain-containing protein [Kineosporiaceae bacterium]
MTNSAVGRSSTARSLLTLLLAGAAVIGVAPGAQASGNGRVIASPCLNFRSAPTGSSGLLGCIPVNTNIVIDCTAGGTTVSGPYGASNLWDHTTYGGRPGYVSDAWVYTGTAAAVAPSCTYAPVPATAGRAVGVKRFFNSGAAGNCTWGAYYQWYQGRGYYPALTGNAKDWAASARRQGWTVVADAQPRSIVVFQPRVYGADAGAGHVGWVTSTQRRADGLYVTFLEMNGTAGLGRWDQRTVKDIAGMSYILAP